MSNWTEYKLDDKVREIIEQVTEGTGEYVDKLKLLNKQVKEPVLLQRLKMRPTFTKEYYAKWEQLQLLFFLACLYHRNELHSLLKDSSVQLLAKSKDSLQDIS